MKKKLNILPSNPDTSDDIVGLGRFPKWLHLKMPSGKNLWQTRDILQSNRMPTVCEEAKCPNLIDCWSRKTATFLVMGKECTRSCGFCDIAHSANPKPLEQDEPARIAQSVRELGLEHVVITMVARDDLSDGGASHLHAIMCTIKKNCPKTTIEILISDLAGNLAALDTLLDADFEIFNHNIETVRTLTPRVRHKATYDRTLAVLQYVSKKKKKRFIKSGLMVGLGEEAEEVKQTIKDLYQVGCEIITIGHYLQPNRRKLRVKSFITPKQFEEYANFGHSIGVKYMYSGPFVRSSYNAAAVFQEIKKRSH